MRRARPFAPPATRESFKDLLIFEERLKQNAERLQKQRRKYEAFLFSLVAVIAYLAYVVFVLPSIYSLVHYGNVAMLLVAVVTLVLFFATGMYSEKIAYAHKRVFVPQANRALRPFNIYLNTRHRSRLSLFRLFGSSAPPSTALSRTSSGQSMASHASSPTLSRRTSASSTHSTSSASGASLRSAGAWRSPPVSPPLSPSSSPPASPSTDPVTRALPPPSPPSPAPRGIPLPPIPPAQNPRGELIFSSRVSAQFREGYERYRGEWERRRAEAKRVQRERAGGWGAWVRRAWRGGAHDPPAPDGATPDAGEKTGERRHELVREDSLEAALLLDPREPRSRESSAPTDGTFASSASSSASSGGGSTARGEGEGASAVLSSTSTPASSRSASPVPLPLARHVTPPSNSTSFAAAGGDSPSRIRAESFSDLLTFDARSESGALRCPGLERSNSMRGGG